MRFWNIGGEGQVLIGGLATAACMILLGDRIPNWLLIVVMVVGQLSLAGAIWGFIPAFFKARWNTNETLFTLMMNYVATQLVAFFIIVWEVPKGAGKIGIINQSTEAGWLPQIGSNKYLLNIIIVAVLTVLMYVYLNYSKHGYEIAVVGESERTAQLRGHQGRARSSSAPCSSPARSAAWRVCCWWAAPTTPSPPPSPDGRGFTAVMVSWLAKFNPITMVFTSLPAGLPRPGRQRDLHASSA